MTKTLFGSKFKKAIAALLALVLVIGLCPMVPPADTAYGEPEEPESGQEATALTYAPAVVDNLQDEARAGTLTFNGNVLAVPSDGVVRITQPGTLEVDGTVNCRVVISGVSGEGKQVTLKGSEAGGTLDATGLNGSVVHVIASNLTVQDGVTIKGGTGSRLEGDTCTAYGAKQDHAVCLLLDDHGKHKVAPNDERKLGGGILIQRQGSTGGSLTIQGGTITDNTAAMGGGIFVDAKCAFLMEGGTVSNNTATKHEGGGIYLNGKHDGNVEDETTAKIEAGKITDNHTQTTVDWGGGGIFIQSQRMLWLTGTVAVTGNTADGLGGGISGCPHAEVGLGTVANGMAIYGNTAKMERHPDNQYLWQLKHEGYYVGDQWLAWPTGGYTQSMPTPSGGIDTGFQAQHAMDYYCVNGSYVFGQQFYKGEAGTAWSGRVVAPVDSTSPNGPVKVESVTVPKGGWLQRQYATVGLTYNMDSVPANAADNRAITITGNTSTTHGGGIACNGTLAMGIMPGKTTIETGWGLDIKKELQDELGNSGFDKSGFEFQLIDNNGGTSQGNVVATAKSDAEGNVHFDVNSGYEGTEKGRTYKFLVREVAGTDVDRISYDTTEYPVSVTVKKVTTEINAGAVGWGADKYITSEVVDGPVFTVNGGVQDHLTITNTYKLTPADWAPALDKKYIDMPGGTTASFTLAELTEDPTGKVLETVSKGGSHKVQVDIPEGSGQISDVAFESISFTEPTAEGSARWFLLTEDGAADPVAYVYKVQVSANDDMTATPPLPATELSISSIEAFYAESVQEEFDPAREYDSQANPLFVNKGPTYYSWAMGSYAVHAISGEVLSQKCLVDPKIYKELNGRALKEGEFTFDLIQTAAQELTPDNLAAINDSGYAYATKPVISTASNDRYGMVDFDAANNLNPDKDGEPCCLLFTEPGIYKYRVIEKPGVKQDPSVIYSTDVITFTAVVEEVDGALKPIQMYYGQLVDGVNQVLGESVDDPTWHPTMVNEARPMDLKVRKTSDMDRDKGLDGATYGLYLVNDAEQNDVLLAQATSPEGGDGWITYSDVSLNVGDTYYFREIAAPSGHTVDPLRSQYFSLVPDDSSPTGFGLQYRDTKLADAAAPAGSGSVASAAREASLQDASGESAETTPGAIEGDRQVYTYQNDGGVYDETTDVGFSKRDTRTQEWVTGAKLAIIEADTGTTVDSWTTGESIHKLTATLDVGKHYILRELEAPEGYAKADDAEFHMDDYGAMILDSGATKGDLRNADVSGNTLTLYDTLMDVETVEQQERVTPSSGGEDGGSGSGSGNLPKTGDELMLQVMQLVGSLVLLSALVVASALLRRRLRS